MSGNGDIAIGSQPRLDLRLLLFSYSFFPVHSPKPTNTTTRLKSGPLSLIHGNNWSDGALSRKQKKLMANAIAAAMRDDHALHAQMQGAKQLGVTMAEVEEALRVTFMLAGMPSYVYGKTEAAEIFK